jgi:hypothetical protein
MTGVANGDGSRVSEFYGLSTDGYYSTNLHGSDGDKARAESVELDGRSGIPGVGVTDSLSAMADPGTDTTTMPGQLGTSEIAPGPGDDYRESGAGQGSTDHWHRHSWQGKAGDAR